MKDQELNNEKEILIGLFKEKNKNFNKEKFIEEMDKNIQEKIINAGTNDNNIESILSSFMIAHLNQCDRAFDKSGMIPYSLFYTLKSYIDAFHGFYLKRILNEMRDKEKISLLPEFSEHD